VITRKEWHGVTIDPARVTQWIEEGVRHVRKDMESDITRLSSEYSTLSGDTMVLVHGRRFEDGEVSIDGYVTTLRERFRVANV
jgi:hypothetical protein